jgi:hypothetical protein
VGWALTIVACLAIAYGTLSPRPGMSGREGYAAVCRICDGTPGVDVIANVVLFIPLGVGLILSGMRPVRALLVMAGMTTAIELAQLRLVPGRDASVVDIVTNLTGALVGVLVGRRWRTLVSPDARAAASLAVGAAATFLAVVGATSVALTPSLPSPPWQSNRGPGSELGPSSRILDVRVAGQPVMVDDTVRNAAAVRAGLLAGKPVIVSAIVPRDPAQSTHLAQILDFDIDDIVVMSRVRDDAVFHLRNAGRDARLREVAVRLTGFFREPGSDTVRVTGAWERGSLVIAGQRGSTTREYALPLTASLGWAFLLPNGGVGPSYTPVSAAWLAILLFPFAYWSTLAARASSGAVRWRVVQAMVIAAALLGPSQILPLAPPRWWEWVVALAVVGVTELAAVAIFRWTHVPQDRARDGQELVRT